MFRNYFKVAIRTLLGHKLFSAINLFGLSIGLTFALVIGVFVMQQYGINRSLKNADRHYIIKSKWKQKEMGLDFTTIPPLAKTLKEEYPDLVANYYRYNPVTNVVSSGDKHYKEDMAIGDTTLITMYGFPLVAGDKERPFTDKSSAVITETMSKKLFGAGHAIGKTIGVLGTQGSEQLFKVSAVAKDIPYNSVTHLMGSTYNVFLPTEGSTYYQVGDPSLDWSSASEIAMIELKPGIDPAKLSAPAKQLLKKYAPKELRENLEVEFAAIKDYYLKDNDEAASRMIAILSIAAIFILVMAAINFVNIYIGLASGRLKEIGLRKVFGSRRRELQMQFIFEALILSTLSAVIALVLYQSFRPVFNDVLNTTLVSVSGFGIETIVFIAGLILLTGVAAGAYPAYILSSSRVTSAVKGKTEQIGGNNSLRRIMLTAQYALAIIVFVCSVTVARQVDYIFGSDIGYKKDQLLIVTVFPKQWDSIGVNRMLGIRDAMRQTPTVKEVSLSFEIPERLPPNSLYLSIAGTNREVLVPSCGVDEKFGSAFGLTMLAGSFFAQDGGYISDQMVLNESAVRALGLTPAAAINRQVTIKTAGSDPNTATVAGVVKDFNYSTLHDKVGPLGFFHIRDAASYRYLSFSLSGGNIRESVEKVRQKWKELSPNAPFEYTFMDDKFASMYQADLRLKKAASMATVLNLIIVFLGVFGVVSFTLAKRTKEVAIRRVLGASVRDLVILFTRDYALIMLIANLLAWPVAYILIQKWLDDFAYRINPGVSSYFIVAFVIAAGSLVLIATQSGRAAISNPIKSLRSE